MATKTTGTREAMTSREAKAQAKRDDAQAKREANNLAMLETIISTIDSAFGETTGRADTETRPTGESYKNMASLFGSIIHDLAENLNWIGFREAMIALKDNKGFAYFGNPYNDKLIKSLIHGYTAKLGKKEKLAILNKAMGETLTDATIEPLEKIKRSTAIQERIDALNN